MKLRCTNTPCAWQGDESDVLKASHPFKEGEQVWGCPACRAIDTLMTVCDTPGCWELAHFLGEQAACSQHVPSNSLLARL
jgi:hypothetical protein